MKRKKDIYLRGGEHRTKIRLTGIQRLGKKSFVQFRKEINSKKNVRMDDFLCLVRWSTIISLK